MKFSKIVGTGGIGKGMLFLSDKTEILGRSESRVVDLSPAKDYCKQQIVFYYIARILEGRADIYPIGYVGNDETGKALRSEMKKQGMNVDYIGVSTEKSTTVSICLQYSDKETCNITAGNSASSEVTPQYITHSARDIGIDEKTVVCAIPEVCPEARIQLLKEGKEKGAFCVLSVAASEVSVFDQYDAYRYCDLISVNMEEAQSVSETAAEGIELMERLVGKLKKSNPDIAILMTCGKDGAFSWKDNTIERIPPLIGNAVNTTGAGDAFLGGTVAGLAFGLKLQKGKDDLLFGESALFSAAELGTVCAGMAVETEDSIATHVNRKSVRLHLIKKKISVSEKFKAVLDD